VLKILLIGVVALAVAALGFWLATTLLGSDNESAPEEAEATSEDAEIIVPETPVRVAIDDGTEELERVHPLELQRRSSGTIVVTSTDAFDPQIALVNADGDEVPLEGVAVGDHGGAVALRAPRAGSYELVVGGFSEGQAGYRVEYLPQADFVAFSDLTVGDCVNRLSGERWMDASGFFIVPCGQPHEGQVLERLPSARVEGQGAQERCDIARHRRIRLGGYVNWTAYWGDGVTCIIRNRTSALLTGPIVDI